MWFLVASIMLTTTPPEQRYVVASSAFLRDAPAVSAPVRAKLPIGTALLVSSCTDGWCKGRVVRERSSQTGFIAQELLSARPPNFNAALNDGRVALERACAMRPNDVDCLHALAAVWRVSGDTARAQAIDTEATAAVSRLHGAGAQLPGKLAVPGVAHADEMPFRDGDAALALCDTALVATRVVVRSVPDPVFDEGDAKTARELLSAGCEGAAFFISGPGLVARPIARADITPAAGDGSDHVLTIRWRAGTHQLALRQNGISLDGTIIAAGGASDDAWPTLLFAGDLDGDSELDFIIDVSWHYNMSLPTLFLSSSGHKGSPAAVAQQVTTGC